MTTPTLYLWLKPASLILLLFLLSACGGGGSTTASGTTTAGNAAPVVADVSGTVDEDTAKSVTLPGTDADGNALTYSVVTPPTNGAVTVSGGIATYTPALNYNGADSFTYKANDGTADSATATVSITVTPVNDPPTANSGITATTDEDTAKDITLVGSDIESSSLTYAKASDPAHGTVSINTTTGVARYTPAANYHGGDSFTYKANDGTADSATATVSITVTPVNDSPTANAGTTQTVNEGASVTLTGSGTDVDGDTLTYRWEQMSGSFVTLTGVNTTAPSFTAPSVVADAITPVFELKVSDGKGGIATARTTVIVLDATVQPSPMRRLNDTGITECGYLNISTIANGLCPQPDYPAQDGDSGRDAVLDTNIGTDGHAGFSFTKLDANGVALADQSVDYATTPWSCVKDNVTGLIWEVKTDDSGLHDKDDRYNWYSTDTATNGGSNGFDNDDGAICFGYTAGNAATYCNTEAYVNRVNATGLCGANSGWRLPNVTELRSIVDLSRNKPSIDPAYFPNTAQDWYWVGTPDAADTTNAMNVSFQSGAVGEYGRSKQDAVRLVRSSQ